MVAVDPRVAAASRAALRKQGTDAAVVGGAVRAVSVRPDRRDRRLRARGRLRARDPDAAALRPRRRRDHPGPRVRSPVVRRLGQPRALARHVAERGLCDLGRVALAQQQGGPDHRRALPRARSSTPAAHRALGLPAGGDPGAAAAFRRPRSTPAARWRSRRCASESAIATSTRSCATGRPQHAYCNANTDDFIALAEAQLGRAARRPLPALAVRAAASRSASATSTPAALGPQAPTRGRSEVA